MSYREFVGSWKKVKEMVYYSKFTNYKKDYGRINYFKEDSYKEAKE